MECPAAPDRSMIVSTIKGIVSMISDPFSERELEILRLIADGASNEEIAHRLYLAVGTVKWYNTQIYAKLGVKSRTQAIQRADQLGLLERGRDGFPNPARAGAAQTNNLPALPTPVAGRSVELAEIADLLDADSTRLLTLIGPGGIGKTWLAIEAARQAQPQFRDGVYFISLAALASPDDIASTIAAALDFRPEEGDSPTEAMIDALRARTLLLAMDNFDSLTAGASVVKSILTRAPHVKILVTSRERLNLEAETLYRVGGLKVPSAAPQPFDELLKNGAVTLFLTHAQRIRPDYRPSADDLQAIAAICRLVEGMPLGIVLAAAWMEMLTPAEIAREIATSLDFLAFYSRDLPEHHQSIRAVFASTWRRLSEAEQRIFTRVSVFRGSFTREAANAVGAATLHELMMLANKSLITRDAEGRYSTHPLLRQYASEQLEISRAADDTFAAHSRYYHDLLASDWLGRVSEPEIAAQIALDFENVRAACIWAVEHEDFPAIDASLDTLYAFCMQRSRYVDLLSLLDRVLEGARKHNNVSAALLRRLKEYRTRAISQMEGQIAAGKGLYEVSGSVWEYSTVATSA